jgi:hypothetical protein
MLISKGWMTMFNKIMTYKGTPGRKKDHGRKVVQRIFRQAAGLLLCAMLTCAWCLVPGDISAATDIYYFQRTVAGARVCGGDVTPTWTTPIYSQSVTGEANILPAGGSITSNSGFPGYQTPHTANRMNWDPGTGTTGIGMYSVPYAVPMTIASISLRLSYAIVNSTIQSEPGFARFYDVDGNAACSDGLLIGQTPDLVFPLSKVTLDLKGLSYNIQPGHRIRVELWHNSSWLGGASGEGSMSITYGTGTDSGLIIDQTPTSTETCTVGPGAVLPDAIIIPGGPETAANAFTLQTSTGTDSVLLAGVSLSQPGSSAAISAISVKSDDGNITYGSVVNPATEPVLIPLSTPITATTTPVQYKIMVTPKTAAAIPSGSSYAVRAFVSRIDSSYTKVYNDTPSTTVTINNLTAGMPAWGSIIPGDSSVLLNWTNPEGGGFQSVLVLRGTTPVTATPVNGSSYTVGSSLGASKVVYTGNLQTFTDGLAAGDYLWNGTPYYYRIFARNTSGTYSLGATAGSFTPVQSGTGSVVVGDGTNPANRKIGLTSSANLDAFTITSWPPSHLSSVTFTLPPGMSAYRPGISLYDSNGNSRYQQATSDTVVFSNYTNPATGLKYALGSVSTPFMIQISANLNYPPPAGTEMDITGIVTAVTVDNPDMNMTYNDTASATITIDNKPTSDPVLKSMTPGDSRVGLGWQNPADSDTYGTLILRNTVPVTDAPRSGFGYSPGYTIGTSTVAYRSAGYAPLSSEVFTDSGLVNGTSYYYKIFTLDQSYNYSSGLPVGPGTPIVQITVGNGTDPANSTIAPGSSAASLDAFTVTSTSSASINSVTVTLSPGAPDVVGSVRITSSNGVTVYGSIDNPVAETMTIPTTGFVATVTPLDCRIQIIPKSHAEMPAVPGAEVAVTGRVTAVTTVASTDKVYNDTTSATLTVDNLSPGDPVGAVAEHLDGGFYLSWLNPVDPDYNSVVVLRDTVPVTGLPAEGASYVTGMTIGSSNVVYSGNLRSYTDMGLINGSNYHYRLFSLDSHGNYSAGRAIGPLAPLPSNWTIAGTAAATMQGLDAIAVVMPFSNDANGNGTCGVEYKLTSGSIWAPWQGVISRSAANCTTIITGLVPGSRYDVRMVYNDSDGLLGNASQTVSGIVALSLLQTTAGMLTANLNGESIYFMATFTNDYNHDNSCLIEYKRSVDNTWTTGPGVIRNEGFFGDFIVGLRQGVSYDVRVTYIDPDGVNGSAVQIVSGLVTPSVKNPRMIHSSLNANKKGYWSEYGGWGVPGGQYGEFTCMTCHELRARNVAGVKSFISLNPLPQSITPDSNWGGQVRFDGPASSTYGFGDDSVARPFPQEINRICEVCHSLTRGGPGNIPEANKPPEHRKIQLEPASHNPPDCTRCHTHDTGFKSPF